MGCGTGLIGKKIGAHCSRLEGIDLSKDMLLEAEKKNIYDKLYHSEIIDHLKDEELDFDFFIAADVFVYVGDLEDILGLIRHRNKRPGVLVFSTEHTQKDGFFLEKSGRYSHSKKYVKRMCDKFNYKLDHFEKVELRKEKDSVLEGGLYLLSF